VKAGLIAHDRKFAFITQTQTLMNAPSNITATDSQSKGSPFSSCFGEPYEHWHSPSQPEDGCVAVQLRGIGLWLVLWNSFHFSQFWALNGLQLVLIHPYTFLIKVFHTKLQHLEYFKPPFLDTCEWMIRALFSETVLYTVLPILWVKLKHACCVAIYLYYIYTPVYNWLHNFFS